jgi:class 3 adenylate cyclase
MGAENGVSPPDFSIVHGLKGRDREIDEIKKGLDSALAGRGAAFFVSGPAGIGKTRLAQEVELIAAARGFSVIWGRCWESGGAPVFWPWVQVLRAALRLCSEERFEVAPEFKREIERQFLPGPSLENIGAGASRPANALLLDSAERQSDRFYFFDAVARFFREVANARPLTLILDDFHEADHDSIHLARFLSRELRRSRVLLLAHYREGSASADEQVAHAWAQLKKEGREIILSGLPSNALRDLAAERLGYAPDASLISALQDVTDGNPFFAEEIVSYYSRRRGALRADDLASGVLRVPDSVRALLDARLDLLSLPARETMRVAAVIGRDLDVDLLRRVVSLSGEAVASHLDETLRLGLVKSTPEVDRSLRFEHSLVAETLLAELNTSARQHLHMRVADAIEGFAPMLAEARVSELAHHYFESLPLGPADKACSYAERAAESALHWLAYEEASRLYQMALRADELAGSANLERRANLLIALGQAQCLAQEYEKFRASFTHAAEIARAIHNGDLFARAVLGIGMLGNYETADPTMVALLDEAIGHAGKINDGLRAALLTRMAEEIGRTGAGERSHALINDSIAIARGLEDPTALVQALYIKLHSIRGPNFAEERSALADEILALVENRGMRSWTLRARYHHAAIALEFGNIDKFYADLAAMQQIPDRLRLGTEGLSFAEITDIIGAMTALMDGRIQDSEAMAQRAFASGSRRPNKTALQIFFVQTVSIRREQGRLAELVPILAAQVAANPVPALSRCGLAFCRSETGLIDLARPELVRLANANFGALPLDFMWLPCLAYLAETCARLDEMEIAAHLYRLLEPYGARHVAIGCFVYLGAIPYYLGLLATTLLDVQGARRHFEAALKAHSEMGASVWVLRTQLHYARMLLSLSNADRGTAIELLDACRRDATALGLQNTAQQAAALAEGREVAKAASASGQTVAAGETRPGRILATILFVDVINSTVHAARLGDRRWGDLLDSFYAIVRRAIRQRAGREISSEGDGFLAIFDRPLDGLECALDIRRSVARVGLEVRAGLHTGECEFVGNDIRGLSVHIGARVAALAGPGEVMTSSTTRDLTVGSALRFVDRGAHELKGIADPWRLYSVAPPD